MRLYTIVLTFLFSKALGQQVEVITSGTLTQYQGTSFLYTDRVILKSEIGSSFRVSASENGAFFIRPAQAADGKKNIPPSQGENFTIKETVLIEGITDEESMLNQSDNKIAEHFTYFDDLGRISQEVSKGITPAANDLITFNIYEANTGKQKFTYLPYVKDETTGSFKLNALTDQAQFYGPSSSVTYDTRPFAETIFANSSAGQPLEVFGVGSDWKTDERSIRTNQKIVMAPSVYFWKYDESTKLPRLVTYNNASGLYPAGMVSFTESFDEGEHEVRAYHDFTGNLVLREVMDGGVALKTYNVYDGQNRLRIVFPPEACHVISQYLDATDNLERQDFLDQWAYQYIYDGFGRLIKKKTPSAGWQLYVYDKWDRLVLTKVVQSQSEWVFAKYDRFNRVVLSGIYSTSASHETLQTTALGMADAARFESSVLTSSIGYTLGNSFPTSGISAGDLHVINYYDNYDFLVTGWDSDGNSFQFQNVNGYPQSTVKHTSLKGQKTGCKVRVLGESNRWLNSVIYYYNNYYPLQIINEAFVGGTIVTTNKHDFIGNIEKTHELNTYSSISQEYFFTQDHAGRVIKIEHSLNGNQPVVMLSKKYNEVGQLIEKNVHAVSPDDYLQSVDYRYNIRGWLTHINNSSLAPEAGDANPDLFGMEIGYNPLSPTTINGSFTTSKFYDGNLSSVRWKTNTLESGVTPAEHIYGYNYDDLSRLTKAQYATNNNGVWNGNSDFYNEQVASYDKHGNIITLSRNSATVNTSGVSTLTEIDNLSYEYNLNGQKSDRLVSITDVSANQLGFASAASSVTEEFLYDLNGNLIYDHNRGISDINYNHINLPTSIEFTRQSGQVDRLVFQYDALGNKVSQQVEISGQIVWTTKYGGGYQYDQKTQEANRLSFFSTPEGRIVNNGTGYDYEYFLKDYLGNTRVVYGLGKDTRSYRATMEPARYNTEAEQGFKNIGYTAHAPVMNYTPASAQTPLPDRSAVCNASQPGKAHGPAIALSVSQGDAVYMDVMARYSGQISGTRLPFDPALLVNALTSSAVFNIPNSGETAQLFSEFSSNVPTAVGSIPPNATEPKAYLVFLFFNSSFNFVTSGAAAVSDQALGKWENLSLSFTAPTNGHLYIYVASETIISGNSDLTKVFFDEMSVIHQRNNAALQVMQARDYYPFGLSFNEYNKDKLYAKTVDANNPQNNVYASTLRNRYLLTGQEAISDFDLKWFQFEARMYDASLSRWLAVDPLAGSFSAYSTYNYVLNNPNRFIDPDGRYAAPWSHHNSIGWHSVLQSVREHQQAAMNNYQQQLEVSAQVTQAQRGYPTSWNAYQMLSQGYSPTDVGEAMNGNVPYPGNTPVNRGNTSSYDDTAGKYITIASEAAQYVPMAGNLAQMYTSALNGDPAGVAKYGGLAMLEGAAEVGAAAYLIGEAVTQAAKVGKNLLTAGELVRIENAATRIGKPINVVGSRASGTAKATSDWDYVIEGLTNKQWKQIKNSLPGAPSPADNLPRMIDIFRGPVDPTKPFITIYPWF